MKQSFQKLYFVILANPNGCNKGNIENNKNILVRLDIMDSLDICLSFKLREGGGVVNCLFIAEHTEEQKPLFPY